MAALQDVVRAGKARYIGASAMPAWRLAQAQHTRVTAPLIGATKLDHLDDALAAMDVRLTSEEVARLEAPYLPRLATSYA